MEPHALLALGGALTEVAADLQWQATSAAESAWALGPGDSAAALASVLGDFEHRRQVLGRGLDDLAGLVVHAGRLYVDAELAVGGWLDPARTR